MKVLYNRFIPIRGFVALNFFGIILVRKEYEGKLTEEVIRHEMIHTAQMKELWYVGFYVLYILEWLYKVITIRDFKKAYRRISFEQEAYLFQGTFHYVSQRSKMTWTKFL